MRPGDAVSMIARPAFSGTMRARRAKKDGRGVIAKQWAGYVAVAAATTWLTRRLNDLVDERLGRTAH